MSRHLLIAVIVLTSYASSRAQTYDDVLARMQSRVQALRTYKCVFISFARGPKRTDSVTYHYYFKKPHSVRMEAKTGKYEGSVLLYTGGDVHVKPGHGMLSLFSYSFAPTHKYVCDPRGNGLPESTWGWYIDQHLLMKPLTRSKFMGSEIIGGKRALKFLLTSINPAQTRSIAAEQFWADAQTFLLIQYRQFDVNGTLIQSGLYQDCSIDSDLPDSLFTEFSTN